MWKLRHDNERLEETKNASKKSENELSRHIVLVSDDSLYLIDVEFSYCFAHYSYGLRLRQQDSLYIHKRLLVAFLFTQFVILVCVHSSFRLHTLSDSDDHYAVIILCPLIRQSLHVSSCEVIGDQSEKRLSHKVYTERVDLLYVF